MRKSGSLACAICATRRWSVPQHPPMRLSRASCLLSAAYCAPSSTGSPLSSSEHAFNATWLRCEAFARKPRIRANQAPPPTRIRSKCVGWRSRACHAWGTRRSFRQLARWPWEAGLLRRPCRANRFVHVIHFDLCVVASLCLLRRHDVIWNVAIPAGAEASADDPRRFLGVVLVATLPAISAQA